MNYFRIYNSLITRAKSRIEQIDHGEMHHIKPRCMGGGDQKDNLVLLTYREHFIAHLLLVKMYPNNTRLYFAFNCFSAKYRSGPFYSARKLPELSGRMFEKMKLEAKVRMNQDESWRNCSERVMNTIWITNGKKNKRVKGDVIQSYLEKGWKEGRTYHTRKNNPEMYVKIAALRRGKPLSKEAARKSAEWQRNHPHCWVSKDDQSKQIYLTELDQYLNAGWVRGRHTLQGKWMTNGEKIKMVQMHEISFYKKKGYREGRI